MAYYPDFYHPNNIIGYTGDLNNKPTVYFMRKTGVGYRFGRIIQKSKNPARIGRSVVREFPVYRIENRGGRVCESYDGIVRKGRRRIKMGRELDMRSINTLAQAIRKLPNRTLPKSFDPAKYWET